MTIVQHDGKSCPFPHWKESKGEHNPYVFRRNGHKGYCLPDPKGPGWVWDHATRGDDIICYSLLGQFESGVPIDHTLPTHKNPTPAASSMFAVPPKAGSVFNIPVEKVPTFAIPPSKLLIDTGLFKVKPPSTGVDRPEHRAFLRPAMETFNVEPPSFIVPPVPAFKVPEPATPKFVPMNDEWYVGVVPVRSGWYEAIVDRKDVESQEMLWYSDTSKIWLTTEHKGVRVSHVKAWRGMVKA